MDIKEFDANDWSGLTTTNIHIELTDDEKRRIGKALLPMFNWDAPLMETSKIEYCECCGQIINR